MSYEDEVRKQMEQAAAQQQVDCPLPEDVDAAFGFREKKKAALKGVVGDTTKNVQKRTAVVRHGGKKLGTRPKGAESKANHMPTSRAAAARKYGG